MSALTYRIHIHDRDYSKWSFVDGNTNNDIDISNSPELSGLAPDRAKLFSGDCFAISDPATSTIARVSSEITSGQIIPGILILDKNKTYGRTENKKKLLYKCVPDDKHLPAFLVPYEIRVGFAKTYANKYVLFQYANWNNTHPHGILKETLGDVDHLPAIYEYQLHCKHLHASLTKFTQITQQKLRDKSADDYISQIAGHPAFNIRDQSDARVFTIDPVGSQDFDDAFSIQARDDGTWNVSVYISNVYVWIETLQLWDYITPRAATIYLPDRCRSMLPSILSDTLCSLQENQSRFAFVMQTILSADGRILDIYFNNARISVYRNYRYEEPDLIAGDANYRNLLELSRKMNPMINNSHDLVSYWMIQMNSKCGEKMAEKRTGIFRSAVYTSPPTAIPDSVRASISVDTQRMMEQWNHVSGEYVLLDETVAAPKHDVMGIQSYIHITSPIRRKVDLINMMLFIQSMGIVDRMNCEAETFIDNQLSEMRESGWRESGESLNRQMKAIRKLQMDCELLERCFTRPDIMGELHEGIVMNRMRRTDGRIGYVVYLEKLKMMSRLCLDDELEMYSFHLFRVYLFEGEDKLKKKIRLTRAAGAH